MEEKLRAFCKIFAMQMPPSNDAMNATRFLKEELPIFIQKEINLAVNAKVKEVRGEILEVLACYISYGTTDEIKAVNDILKFPSLSTNNTQ